MNPETATEWYQFTCPRCQATWTGRYQVRRVTARDDEQPLRPGDSHVIVTISVPVGGAPGLFSPGSRFALWAGADVGHGTVSRRVFFS